MASIELVSTTSSAWSRIAALTRRSVSRPCSAWPKLNPFRNYEKGIEFCQQFLKDYPDSEKRQHVQQLLEQYRTALADQP